ncbi:phosphate signaling complex protein PhoU [Fodinicola acaciae]|uniref:phosphate signaling complex protein PhoU n=1 Tax=Fodinicola acaciae TaxID=2681555 RepID=UPI0013D16FF6|nr:phosphate signaling complex protein PhoU [Fodinicola acaciae]
MRTTYHEELAKLGAELAGMARTVDRAMRRASTALLDTDGELADKVIAEDAEIDALRDMLDDQILDMLARQQPVAIDLRTLVAGLRISGDLERMGDLARHVAEVARRDRPTAMPPRLRDAVEKMSQVAHKLAGKVAAVLESRDAERALELDRDDDEMDLLQDSLYRELLAGDWGEDVEVAMEATLVGRFYERYADHAVAVADRVAFLAGERGLDGQRLR